MKKHCFLKIVRLLFLIAFLFVFSFSAGCSRSAPAPQERITSTLSALGVTDARQAPSNEDPALSAAGCLLYTSDSTQMGYYFDPHTGALTDIFQFQILGGTYREKASAASASTPMVFSGENREDALLTYAGSCIGADLIGTLQLRIDQEQRPMHQYTVLEYYDGIGTGTSVVFTTGSDGHLEMCHVTIGSVFERAKDGTYVIAAGDNLIGENAAIDAARGGLDALGMAVTVSGEAECELTAAEDRLIYIVRIDFTDNNNCQRQYLAYVNAHTGELWQEGISK